MRIEDLLPKRETTPVRIELGSGPHGIEGFYHVDAVEGGNVNKVCDIRNLDWLKDDLVDELYSAHTVEHISYTEIVRVLKEWYRVLKPGGKITIKMPDLDFLCKAYVNHVENRVPRDHEAPQQSPEEIMVLMFGGFADENGKTSEHFFGMPGWQRGLLTEPMSENGVYSHWESHKALYNYEMLKKRLEMSGFTGTQRVIENDWELHVVAFKPKPGPREKITYHCVTVPNLNRMRRNLPLILPFVDEAVLVIGKQDPESIAYFKSFPNVKVVYREWDDLRADQYQAGLNLIKEGWVLVLDDDEVPTEEMLKSLRGYITKSQNGTAFDAVAFSLVDIDETGHQSKHYNREIFYKWRPNLRYEINAHHCSLIGLQKNTKAPELIYHRKTRREQLLGSFNSYWVTGVWADHKESFEYWFKETGQDPRFSPVGPLIPNTTGLAYPLRDGFKTDSWLELKTLIKEHHPAVISFRSFLEVLSSKGLHSSIVDWAFRNNEQNDTRPHLQEQHALYSLLQDYGYL